MKKQTHRRKYNLASLENKVKLRLVKNTSIKKLLYDSQIR